MPILATCYRSTSLDSEPLPGNCDCYRAGPFKLSIEDIADDFAREMLVRLSTPARAIHVGANMRKPGEMTVPNMESGEGLSIRASGTECFE